jgi:hypothetical protein
MVHSLASKFLTHALRKRERDRFIYTLPITKHSMFILKIKYYVREHTHQAIESEMYSEVTREPHVNIRKVEKKSEIILTNYNIECKV